MTPTRARVLVETRVTSETRPFDDIRALAAGLPDIGEPRPAAIAGLGRAGELASWMAALRETASAGAERALVCLFVSSHGVAFRGEERDPVGAARSALDAFAGGIAPINAACTAGALGFKAFDLALDLPTGDLLEGPAMDERGCVATMAFGMEAVAGGADLLGLGSASPGGDIAAGALAAALFAERAGDWLPDGASAELEQATDLAVTRARASSSEPLSLLADLGGRDLAAMAGAILAARHQRVPVVLDGFGSAVAAAVLHAIEPAALDHCVAGHVGSHPAHAMLLARLGLMPILPGFHIEAPGIGAALALGILKTAAASARSPGP
jgi:nicotinate-nucleotide--dimethylbenzimidazole phosphoribosyltransferase